MTDTPFSTLLGLRPLADDRFEAPRAPESMGNMYGGQFMAQSLAACQLTVEPTRTVHSLHAYFMRPGNIDTTTEIGVDRVRDGRSFSLRQASVLQNGKELFRMLASFNVPEDSPEYAGSTMPSAPPPEDVVLTYNEFARGDGPEFDGRARPMDIRYINPPTAPLGEPILEDQRMWMKIAESLGDGHRIHDPGLVYLSDSTLVDHIVLPQGQRWHDPQFVGVSLDHAMWFHQRARADEWLLYDQVVEATGDCRGLATGRFYTHDRRLVATCKQEGLIRWNTDG